MDIAESIKKLDKELYNKIEKRWEKIKRIHFDEEHGTPYWHDNIKEYGLKIQEVKKYSLEEFLSSELSLGDEKKIREKSCFYFIPRQIVQKEIHKLMPLTSSGSTNPKKTIAWHENSIKENVKYIVDSFRKDWKMSDRLNCLVLGPSFPAPFEELMRGAIKELRGFLFFAPVETRGLKKLFTDPNNKDKIYERMWPALEYMEEILSKYDIHFISSTPDLWRDLNKKISDDKKIDIKNIRYVYFGGIEVSREVLEDLKKEFKNINFITSYGHFIFGLIFDTPKEPQTYSPYLPALLFFVVKEDDPFSLVKDGERGLVRYVVLRPELLYSQVERDTAIRVVGESGIEKVREIKPTFPK
ncbi:MAG: hypothetical protein QXS37_04905 [Candidatus Aenigmatarchaeota archaeon]